MKKKLKKRIKIKMVRIRFIMNPKKRVKRKNLVHQRMMKMMMKMKMMKMNLKKIIKSNPLKKTNLSTLSQT